MTTPTTSIDMRKAANRRLIHNQRLPKAIEEYKAVLLRLLDEKQGPDIMSAYRAELDEQIGVYRRQHETLTRENPEPRTAAAQTLLTHLNAHITRLNQASRELFDAPETQLEQLRESARTVLGTLEDPDRALLTKNGKLAVEQIKNAYRNSRDETKERFELLDFWYALGNEFFIEQLKPEDRAYSLALIPREMREAHWRFLLSLAEATYAISIPGLDPERNDPNHMTLLSRMMVRLSDHERGADNATMPYTHKYRHGPGIHSLHTAGLLDKVFHNAWKTIDKNVTKPGEREALQKKWSGMREQLMIAALVHDMGEMDGELSQGIAVSTMSREEAERNERTRNELEKQTFERHLDMCRPFLRHAKKQGDKVSLTGEPIHDDEWAAIKQRYMDAFGLAERTDTFLGRMFKAAERMQSNHDYVRFDGLNGAQRLRDTPLTNKCFSLNYVKTVLKGRAYHFVIDGKTYAAQGIKEMKKLNSALYAYLEQYEKQYGMALTESSPKIGPDALKNLVNTSEDAQDRLIFKALSAEMDKEFDHLQERQIPAYSPLAQLRSKPAAKMQAGR